MVRREARKEMPESLAALKRLNYSPISIPEHWENDPEFRLGSIS